MTFWYVATPYSKYPEGMEAAFVMACEQAALLIRADVSVYCPIAHTHPIAHHGGIDKSHNFDWLAVDEPFIKAACGIIIIAATGWRESVGVKHELAAFIKAEKPVIYMTPGVVPLHLITNPKQREYAAKRRAATALV